MGRTLHIYIVVRFSSCPLLGDRKDCIRHSPGVENKSGLTRTGRDTRILLDSQTQHVKGILYFVPCSAGQSILGDWQPRAVDGQFDERDYDHAHARIPLGLHFNSFPVKTIVGRSLIARSLIPPNT